MFQNQFLCARKLNSTLGNKPEEELNSPFLQGLFGMPTSTGDLEELKEESPEPPLCWGDLDEMRRENGLDLPLIEGGTVGDGIQSSDGYITEEE